MRLAADRFRARARRGIRHKPTQEALAHTRDLFRAKRDKAVARRSDFEALRDQGAAIKDHLLANLDVYVDRFQEAVEAQGGQVHWASDAKAARNLITALCQNTGARTVTKGKSMASEEIQLNPALEAAGLRVVETDLGEYIIQQRHERPSHIIAPAVHLSKNQIAQTFRDDHTALPPARNLSTPEALVAEARAMLREPFLKADVGITGANMLVAETGSVILVTNEGNGDLSRQVPRMHIVLAGVEKLVPSMHDANVLLRLLGRSATGQDATVYTSVFSGPARSEDMDGPTEFHVVLLDNGRLRMLGTEAESVLRCIRCGACMNVCPIYGTIGGHAYGTVYPGPIGAALEPGLHGTGRAGHLADATSMCGRCETVCPVKIPLTSIFRYWRKQGFASGAGGPSKEERQKLRLWIFVASRPWLYRLVLPFARLVIAGPLFPKLAKGWTKGRAAPKKHS